MNLTLPLFEPSALPVPGTGAPVPPGPAGVEAGGSVGAAVGVAVEAEAGMDVAAQAGVAPPVQAAAPADPGALHPALWRASQIGGGRQRATASGFEVLDAQLPGQGWPHGELTELLLAQPGIGELRLLAPALGAIGGRVDGRVDAHVDGRADRRGEGGGAPAWAEGPRCVMLFEPPVALSAWALAQQGLSHQHWLVVHARAGQRSAAGPAQPAGRAARAPRTPSGLSPLLPSADLLWALEQALRSGQVGAVLAWLPSGLRADALRRLQLAAQAHDGPVFLFREAQALHRPSAAPLRLLLQPAGVDGLTLRLLKRRGPPLAEPLRLVLPSVLTPHQQARALAQQAWQGAQLTAQQAVQQAAQSSEPAGSVAGPGRGRLAGHRPRALRG